MGCKFIWGEVKELNGTDMTARIKPMFTNEEEVIDFDYCIIAAGCMFGPFHKWGESLWFPVIHEEAQKESAWKHIDERFLEGRRRHILEEYNEIKRLEETKKQVLVVGAGFIGVEWITELQHFFPKLNLSIIDMAPNPLGPLPLKAAEYCKKYMTKHNIKQFYSKGYEPNKSTFWKDLDLPEMGQGVKIYVSIGVKASNWFMPKECLSEKGPGGGGWILMDMQLGVMDREGKSWGLDAQGQRRIYAIGDCNYGCVEKKGSPPGEWPIPPIPKISYPGEEEGIVACTNITIIDKLQRQNKTHHNLGAPLKTHNFHWPWGAGMFATSLGPDDAVFVAGANWNKGSGVPCTWGALSAVQKEIIEASKTDECANGFIGRCIWYFVHHTPVHLWGKGPLWGY